MGKIAFVFAGQGAQHTGMGKDLYDSHAAVKEIFDRADAVRPGTSEQCFEGDAALLAITANTQPCVYTMDYAMAEVLKSEGIVPDMVAGYSLGELAALSFAGAFSFEEGLRIVSERGKYMQEASEAVDTGMMAVLKLQDDVVEELAAKYEGVYPVNFNCTGQITVAGLKSQLDGFKDEAKEAGGLVRILEVSGGFHSPFMAPAAVKFAPVLKEAVMKEVDIPTYSNFTTMPYEGDYAQLLEDQISNPIRWKNEIEHMIEAGADTFIEVGPGTALTKMIKRISKDIKMYNVKDAESLKATIEGVKGDA